MFGDKVQYIGPLESLASVAADFTFSDVLGGEDVMYFVDNQGSLGALVRGSSSDEGMAHLAHEAALQQRRNLTRAWYEWVNSDANISDM